MSRITSCRGCGNKNFEVFLDLGETPLADALVEESRLAEDEERFPLQVAFCEECALVQITEDVEPEKLFVDNYLYFSSFSPALLKHSGDHAHGLIERQGLGFDSLVVEIASNDGYLLKNFVEKDIPVLGLDPAPDQAKKANEIGVRTQAEFFTLNKAKNVREEFGAADVIIANNEMAHIPELISRCAFDTIYHEHYFYHSCLSVNNLVRRHGLYLNDVEFFENLHGGTNRWWIGKQEQPTERLLSALEAERSAGLDKKSHYADFAQQVEALRESLMKIIHDLRDEGKTIAAYGAAAKGATMLNVMGITNELVPYVVDRNTYKQGRYMPGTHQLIRDPAILESDPPDVLLLLAWNFAEEIMAQQKNFASVGGRFLIPVPTPELV